MLGGNYKSTHRSGAADVETHIYMTNFKGCTIGRRRGELIPIVLPKAVPINVDKMARVAKSIVELLVDL